jgi:hypothetical protein
MNTLITASALERPRQVNCQQEPFYPLHNTVTLSISAPEMVAHGRSERCPTEYPHKIADCGEFDHVGADGIKPPETPQ